MPDATIIAERYEVKSKVGDYSRYTLYWTWDMATQKDVIVMLGHSISPHHDQPQYQESELKFMAFTHPNLIRLIDFGTYNQRRYLVLPALVGQPLSDYLAQNPQPPVELKKWVQSLGQVLSYLHSQHIVYTHLSPETIWIDDQSNLYLLPIQVNIPVEPVVMEGLPPQTRYLSPEQIIGQPLTSAVDQYSLAVVIYEILTGNKPYTVDTPLQYLIAVVTGIPDDARTWRADIPQSMNDALNKALSKQPQNRFPTITDFIEELLHDGLPPIQREVPKMVDSRDEREKEGDKKRAETGEEVIDQKPVPQNGADDDDDFDDDEAEEWDMRGGGAGEEDYSIREREDNQPAPPPTGEVTAPVIPAPGTSVAPEKPITKEEIDDVLVPEPEPTSVEDLHLRRSELMAQLLVQRLLQRQSPASSVGVDEAIDKLESEIATLNQQIPERLPTLKEAEAQFTAYYARESVAGKPYGLYVYAHVPDALQQVARDVWAFSQKLGGTVPKPKQAEQVQRLKIGIHLTIAVEAEGLEFTPVAITQKWDVPFTRFDFTYTASQSLVGEIVNGRISVQIRGIEIAHIPFGTLIEDTTHPLPHSDTLPENPLAAARFVASDTARLYQKIFISYSRKDKTVAENYRLAQMAIGHDCFMDSYSIRSGENWQAALATAIDESDIFQLFWSEHAAASENVRNEWDYALRYKCADNQCVGFIRPVYWRQPLHAPPPELGHLNFRFVPFPVG